MSRLTPYLAAAVLVAAPGSLALAQGTGTPMFPEPRDPNTRVASRGANFLEIGVGARAMGLGGAYTALAQDVTALYWNPAGISFIQGASAHVSVADLFGGLGIRHTFLGAVLPVGGSGAIGVGFTQLTSGDIERTTVAYPEGNDPAFGATFSWTSTAVEIAYGRRLTDRLNFGAGVKYVTEGIDNANATYVGLDLGIQFRTGLYGTTIGAALSNLGTSSRFTGPAIERFAFDDFRPGATQVQLRTNSNPLPTSFRFGVRSDLMGTAEALFTQAGPHRLVVSGEILDAIDTDVNYTIGAEYSLGNIVFLRAGKRWVNEAHDESFRTGNYGLSWGGGLSLPFGGGRRLAFDYARTNMGELDNVQIYSFSLGF
jgi:hypothetical protein